MNGIRPLLLVRTPCPKEWAQMRGDDQRRFCEQCQLHVHNLSAMSGRQRRRFIARSAGGACVTYELLPDGSMAVPARFAWVSPRLRRVGGRLAALFTTLLPFAFTSCATDTRSATLGRASSASICGPSPRDAEPVPDRVVITGSYMPTPGHK